MGSGLHALVVVLDPRSIITAVALVVVIVAIFMICIQRANREKVDWMIFFVGLCIDQNYGMPK